MSTPLLWQIVYVTLQAGSAALVLYAALVALTHLYPSLRLFYGDSAGIKALNTPYAAMLVVVVQGFGFASYVTPAVGVLGCSLLLVAAVVRLRQLPGFLLPAAAAIAAVAALAADAALLTDAGVTTHDMLLMAGYVLAPTLAALGAERSTPAIVWLPLYALLALALAVAAAVLTASLAHGSAASMVAAACACVAWGYMLRPSARESSYVGAASAAALLMLLTHAAVVLAHAGQVQAALAAMAALLLLGAMAGMQGVMGKSS